MFCIELSSTLYMFFLFFDVYGDYRDLHGLTHSVPTRRSSDLMAAATNTHSFWELLRIARWHVEGSAYDRALAMIVEAHAALPMAAFWGQGQSASSDGQ